MSARTDVFNRMTRTLDSVGIQSRRRFSRGCIQIAHVVSSGSGNVRIGKDFMLRVAILFRTTRTLGQGLAEFLFIVGWSLFVIGVVPTLFCIVITVNLICV